MPSSPSNPRTHVYAIGIPFRHAGPRSGIFALVLAAAALAAAIGPAPARAQDPEPRTDPADSALATARGTESPDTAGADPTGADAIRLPGVVVTATRVPLHREALPTPVTVLTGDELRAEGIGTVAEALRRVPGATLARAGAPGAQTSLFLRGGESDYVKVLVDGVPVNDPGGAFDFADLSTDQVERIEVVRGPVSVLYGSDAVAGVVQIFTRRGGGPARLSVSAAGGRGERRYEDGGYGVADASATLVGSAGALAYAAGAARTWSAGAYPLNNERDLTTATARVSWTPVPAAELALSSRVTDSRAGFPTDGTGALVDRNARIDRRLWSTSIAAGLRPWDGVDARLSLGLAARRQETADPQDGPADTLDVFASDLAWDVTRRSAGARVSVDIPDGVVTGGIDLERAVAETRYSSRSQWGPTDASAEYARSNTGYYLQLLARPLGRVHVTAGGRVDDNEAFGAFGTYRLGLSVGVLEGTRVRGAVGKAFREPTFDENFGSGFGDRGSPDLEPERSLSWEVGLDRELAGSVRLSATWFDQRFRDLIQFTFAPADTADPNYFNVGEARARGLELEAELTAGRFGATASYAYLDTRVLDPGLATDASFLEGEPLLRRPAHSGTLTGRFSPRGGRLTVAVNVTGERPDLDFAGGFPAPRITLPAHATIDLAAEHALPLVRGAHPRLLVGLRNLLDARYESVAGFPAPGRVVRLGVRIGP